jgi:hypothetical protein
VDHSAGYNVAVNISPTNPNEAVYSDAAAFNPDAGRTR